MKITIKNVATYKRAVKELWEKMKKEVDGSEILEIEVDRGTVQVVDGRVMIDGAEITDLMHTGTFELKLKCQNK